MTEVYPRILRHVRLNRLKRCGEEEEQYFLVLERGRCPIAPSRNGYRFGYRVRDVCMHAAMLDQLHYPVCCALS